MTLAAILSLFVTIWGPLNEIIANVPALKSNSVIHMVVNVINSIISTIKPKA